MSEVKATIRIAWRVFVHVVAFFLLMEVIKIATLLANTKSDVAGVGSAFVVIFSCISYVRFEWWYSRVFLSKLIAWVVEEL